MKILLYASIVCTLLSPSAYAVRAPKAQKIAFVESRLNFELGKIGAQLKPGSIRLKAFLYRAPQAAALNIWGLFARHDMDNVEYQAVYFEAVDSKGSALRGVTGLATFVSGPNSFGLTNCDGVNLTFEQQGKNNGCVVDSGNQFLMFFFNPKIGKSWHNPNLMSELDLNLTPVK